MNRKIVKHGPSTLTVSLPAKWCREQGIKEGDEVNLLSEHSRLIIESGKKKEEEREITLNLSGCGSNIKNIIGACYKSGFQKFVLTFSTHEELEIIQDTSTQFYGFGIVEESRNQVIISELAELKQEKDEAVLRRTFFYLNTIFDDGYHALSEKDMDFLKSLVLRDRELNKLCDSARRHVNMNPENRAALYTIIVQLEKVGDICRDIYKLAAEDKNIPSEKFIDDFRETGIFFRKISQLFYNFKVKETSIFLGYNDFSRKLLDAQNNNGEGIYYTYLLLILSILINLKGAFIVLNFTQKKT